MSAFVNSLKAFANVAKVRVPTFLAIAALSMNGCIGLGADIRAEPGSSHKTSLKAKTPRNTFPAPNTLDLPGRSA